MTLAQAEQYILDNTYVVLEKASDILGEQVTYQSLSGIIGGKNKTYNLVVRAFPTANDYVNAWFNAHFSIYKEERNYNYEKSSHRIYYLLRDPMIRLYVEAFLTRTYYREILKP